VTLLRASPPGPPSLARAQALKVTRKPMDDGDDAEDVSLTCYYYLFASHNPSATDNNPNTNTSHEGLGE
jgi:hypothetical protein